MSQLVTLTLVDVVRLHERQRSVVAGVHTAIVEAGLLDAKSLRYHADGDRELLVAEPLSVKVDGRAEDHARALNIKHSSGERTGTDAVIPAADLEAALGIDAASIVDDGETPLVALYAGHYSANDEPRSVLALGRLPTREISTSVLED